MSGRDDILDKINKKAAKRAEIKQRTCRNKAIRREIIDFFKECEETCQLYTNNESMLQGKLRLLEQKLTGRILSEDASALIDISWTWEARKHADKEFKYVLGVDRVNITWSESYAEKTGIEREESVDAGCLIFDIFGI